MSKQNKTPLIPLAGAQSILLVDDNENVRVTTAEVLKAVGYIVVEAANGVEAEAKYQVCRDQLDLMITDVVMPKMGGVELIRSIRQDNAVMPVILVTGYDQDEVLKSVEGLESVLVLNKPFSFSDLSRNIRLLIQPAEDE